jgi:hypothetical protein
MYLKGTQYSSQVHKELYRIIQMFFLGKLADKEQLLSSMEERSAVYLYGCLPKLFKDGATDQIGKNRWVFFCVYISYVRKKYLLVCLYFSHILRSISS